MTRRARELEHRLAVPIELEKGEAVENRLDGFGRGARAVGVLDAQPEGAADMASVEPVEQRGARIADMEEAGGRRGEAGHNFHWKTGIRARFVLIQRVFAAGRRDGSDLA